MRFMDWHHKQEDLPYPFLRNTCPVK
jgi:hypothetical protein